MNQQPKQNPIETGFRSPAARSEIAGRIKRHLIASHGQPENCRIGYFRDCAACRDLYKQLGNADDAAITLKPVQAKVRIPEAL